jgi:hypothetical protein
MPLLTRDGLLRGTGIVLPRVADPHDGRRRRVEHALELVLDLVGHQVHTLLHGQVVEQLLQAPTESLLADPGLGLGPEDFRRARPVATTWTP